MSNNNDPNNNNNYQNNDPNNNNNYQENNEEEEINNFGNNNVESLENKFQRLKDKFPTLTEQDKKFLNKLFRKGDFEPDDLEYSLIEDDDNIKEINKITRPFLTKYEKVKLLATRTNQLARGAKPMIKNVDYSITPKELAKLELKEKVKKGDLILGLASGNITAPFDGVLGYTGLTEDIFVSDNIFQSYDYVIISTYANTNFFLKQF